MVSKKKDEFIKVVSIRLKDTRHTEKLTNQEFIDIIEGALIQVGFKAKVTLVWMKRKIK